MLIFLYIFTAVLFVSSIFLNYKSNNAPSFWKSLLSIAAVLLLGNLAVSQLVDIWIYVGPYSLANYANYLVLGFAVLWMYFILSLFEFFKGLFKNSVDVNSTFVAILVLVLGGLSLIFNKYDFMFVVMIVFGFGLLASKFAVSDAFSTKSFWLTMLYSLPFIVFTIFVVSQVEFYRIFLISELYPIQLLNIHMEFVIASLIAVLLLLTVYNLAYTKFTAVTKNIRIPKIRLA
jgi:hypothetical protein